MSVSPSAWRPAGPAFPTPSLVPDQAEASEYAGYTYEITGGLVPVLVLQLQPGQSAYFEHHILLWKSPALTIQRRAMAGMVKRMLAGQDLLVTEAAGPGQIAFSREGVGQVFPLHLAPGQSIQAREHQFLAASSAVDMSWERVKGISNMLFGGSGFFIDNFSAGSSDGVVWLHAHGNLFEVTLAAGEQIDVEPGGWVYKDGSVAMETFYQGLSTGLLGGSSLACQRFTGPGRVGIQSGSAMMETAADSPAVAPPAERGAWSIVGSILGALLSSGSKKSE